MNRDIRAMSIAYKLLARMDRRAQVASVEWLRARLDSDARTASEQERIGIDKMTYRQRRELSTKIGDATIGLIGTMMVAGAPKAKRTCEVSGPLAADITISVTRKAQQ